ncbi:GNAT family N-acetyltransferase [Streptomyces sp. NRRL F-4428]|uniref:GNAT family N-acetyltransferase n=1 Tax=Streptomyces sp. NRRL F-4428 TaxID=1609137 RepID=UPI000697222C|nr:GNAT family N-acetyltransferase [Streptomyces sp. NRRL F-4428]
MSTKGAWRIRRAEPGEAAELEGLQERSSAHWGYPPGYFDWAGDAARVIAEAYVRDNPVFVLEEGGRSLGFYGFTESEGGLLLDKLFVDADRIGQGYGRLLWEHALRTARGLGRSEFTIASDPNAAPFYAAMGAVEYATKPTAEPSWTLHMFRCTVPGRRPGGDVGPEAG